jgi:hypothetical protein
MLMESSTATPKKVTRNNKNTCSTTTTNIVTPVKSIKQNKVIDTPVTPVQTRYCTRSSSSTNTVAAANTTVNTTVNTKKIVKKEFDAEFFDESSAAWNQNKKKLGNGMYAYRTRSTTRIGGYRNKL